PEESSDLVVGAPARRLDSPPVRREPGKRLDESVDGVERGRGPRVDVDPVVRAWRWRVTLRVEDAGVVAAADGPAASGEHQRRRERHPQVVVVVVLED